MENTEEKNSGIGAFDVRLGETNQAVTRSGVIPLRIVVLGDYTPEEKTPVDWGKSSRLIDIDKNSYNQVMATLAPSLHFAVTHHLGDESSDIILNLTFRDINSFRPEGITSLVPELASFLSIRQAIAQLQQNKITPAEFDACLSASGPGQNLIDRIRQLLTAAPKTGAAPAPLQTAPTSGATGDSIRSILDLVDTGTPPEGRPTSGGGIQQAIDILLGQEQSRPKVSKDAFNIVLSEIDRRVANQINAILHHSKFQQLESTWRGLKFLVDRLDFRKNIVLQIIPVAKDQVQEAIYHQLMIPEYNETSEIPLSFMIGDYEFDKSADDLEILQNIAKMAAAIQVPFLANVGCAFFGTEKGSDLASLPDFKIFFKKPDYFNLEAFRNNRDSQHIALATPNFLLRYPYGDGGVTVKDFPFTEITQSERDFLWGRSAMALATVIGRSFASTNWPIQFTGIETGGRIENLPVWQYPAPGGRDLRIPLNSMMRESKQYELSEQGFIVISFIINNNNAFVLTAPTLYRPPKFDSPEKTKEAALHSTLAYQLFSARMAHYLRLIKSQVASGMTPEHIQEAFTAKLRGVLSTKELKAKEDSVLIEVSDSEKPNMYYVALRLRPPFRISGYQPSLLLGLEVPR